MSQKRASYAFGLVLCLPLARGADSATEVHSILVTRCAPCHSGDKPAAGLSFNTRDSALKGGASGPAISPGDSAHSLMILKVTGKKGATMPPVGGALPTDQIQLLQSWIDEGAKWPAGTAQTAAKWVAPIPPRRPALPESDEARPVDRFIGEYLAQHHHAFPAPVADGLFARRVYFDIWGLPPTVDELNRFLNDPNPNKREQLIDALLADNQRYAGHWVSWWNDLLRNDTGVNYAGDRKSITPWLLSSLENNMPYDRMISALVNPVAKDDPDGFLVGVNWRGTVNASQTPYMQAAQNTGQVFLGINLKCASCHDSFINQYKLRQSYGMAALFSPESRLELVRCDVKQGKFVAPQVLYPEIVSVAENATLAQRHQAAAQFFTDPRNGRVPRTLVNRFWQKLFGRGLTEPVDEMDAEPWNADLLDWLASDFAEHRYDCRYLLRELMTSKAYQMPAVVTQELTGKSYTFNGPFVRRLSAEQLSDAVSTITGEWRTQQTGTNARLVRDWEVKSSPLSTAMGRPVRDQVFTTRDNRATTFQALELVNGKTLENTLQRGSLRLLDRLPAGPQNSFDSGIVRHGAVPFDLDITGVRQLWLLTQDAGSYDAEKTIAGWVNVELSGPGGTKKLSELSTRSKFTQEAITAEKISLGASVRTPLNGSLLYPIANLGFTRIHGSVAVDDRSTTNDIAGAARFFIFEAQPDPERLVKIEGGAPVPFPQSFKTVDGAIDRLYLTLLSRTPSTEELRASRQFFPVQNGNAQLDPQALQDFLWSMLLHPEFQYIY